MSPREESVLERNLRALLNRAYTPVVARASFRSRLREDFEQHAARRAGKAPGPRPTSRVGLGWGRLVAAALVLLTLGFLLRDNFQLDDEGGPSVEAILASGRVAVREQGAAWREARRVDGVAAVAGRVELDETGAFELRTPAGRTAVLQSPGLELEVRPESAVELNANGDEAASELSLLEGTLELRLEGTLGLSTRAGDAPLEDVQLVASTATGEAPTFDLGEQDWVALQVGSGSLRLGQESLSSGQRGWLVDGRLVRGGRPELEPVPAASGRRAVGFEPVTAPALGSALGEDLETAVLRGTVRAAPAADAAPGEEGPLVKRFRVILLEEKNLPDAAQPIVIPIEDEEGGFAIAPQGPGRHTLFVQADGHAVWKLAGLDLASVPAQGQPVPTLDVNLERGVTVRGIVLEHATGAAVADAVIVSESDAPTGVLPIDAGSLGGYGIVRFARSGPDGRFELEHVAQGTQILRASGGGMAVGWTETLELGAAVERDGVEFRLGPDGAVVGHVLDAGGEPLEGQVVLASVADFSAGRPCLTYRHALTDAQGDYRIEGMPAGLVAVLRFGSEAAMRDEIAPDLRLATVVADGSVRVDFEVRAERPLLQGVLVDEGGQAVAGRAVWAMPREAGGGFEPDRWQSASTQQDGSFRFQRLDPGVFELYVTGRAPSELIRVGTVEVGDSAPRELRLVLGLASISGRVLRSEDGSVPGQTAVLLLERDEQGVMLAGKALVATDGSYVFEDVKAGIYDLMPSSEGPDVEAALPLESLAVGAGDRIENLDFEMLPAGSVEVEVRLSSPDGPPALGARVVFFDARGKPLPVHLTPLVDARGRERVSGLLHGSWTVEAHLAGYEVERVGFEIQDGRRVRVPVVLRPIGR